MNKSETFTHFNHGELVIPGYKKEFCKLPWLKHPTFDGVELKHLVTAQDTNGQFSYHLVRVAPNKKLDTHTHEKQLETHEVISGSGTCINGGTHIPYQAGTLSMMPAGIEHQVTASNDGLYLFAKFFPALC